MKFSHGLVLLLAGVASLPAQRLPIPGGVGSTPGSGNSSIGNTTPPGSSTTQPNDPTTRAIFLEGHVMMDDGSPAQANITIQRMCTGSPRTVAYTDGKGHFSFRWGDTSTLLPDASEPENGPRNGLPGSGGNNIGGANNIGRMGDRTSGPTLGCTLRANAAGFRSDEVDIGGQRALDGGDVGTIVLHRIAGVEGRSISATSLNAPKDAAKAYEKGVQALMKNKPADAEKDFEKAVELYPKYAAAWYDLGRSRLAQHNGDGAYEALLKALEADDKLVGPYVELGQLAAQEQKWPDASKYLDGALRLDPIDFPQLWFMDAVSNFNITKYDAAKRSIREALKADPQHRNPRASQLLGLILIQKGDTAGATEALRDYLRLAPEAGDADQVKQQLVQLGAK